MTAMTIYAEAYEEWVQRYDAQQRRHKRGVWREKGDGFSGPYVMGYIFGEEVSEGGWSSADGRLKDWMTPSDLKAASKRAWARSDATGVRDPKYTYYITHQCGGCKWFAALNADWGFCCCEVSPNDGRVVFEHGGCDKHSEMEGANS